MKPQFIDISGNIFHSYKSQMDVVPNINSRWHCHSALELVYFKKGCGTQFIGDSLKSFSEGDIVLVGKNLPHYWRFAVQHFDNPVFPVEVYVIHFNDDLLGNAFFILPEFNGIKKALNLSKQGLQINGKNKNKIAAIICRIIKTSGSKRLSLLIDCLSEIARCTQSVTLVSNGFQLHNSKFEDDRMQTVYRYTVNNYKRKIDLQEIASVTRVSPNSFCRFFKTTTKKTYTQFLNEVRIGQACKLLIENRLSVKEVCYESGFFNFSSFYKSFKSITGKTPLVYQKKLIKY